MSSELLKWVYAYLERDEEIVVPVKKMWNEWRAAHPDPSLADFTASVLADARVEEMPGVDHAEGMEGMSPEALAEYIQEMEARGYFSGPRVKLRSRQITREHVARMLKKHNDRMEAALRQAREAMPDDVDEQEEGALIGIIHLARRFRKHLRKAGLEPDNADEAAPDP